MLKGKVKDASSVAAGYSLAECNGNTGVEG